MASDLSSDSRFGKPSQIPKPSGVARAALAISRNDLLTEEQLPRELVDQILDDLTVFKVLQLSTCQQVSLDRAIVEHDRYKHLFRSDQELFKIRDLFVIYHEIHESLDRLQASDSPLSLDYDNFAADRLRLEHGYLVIHLWNEIIRLLPLHDGISITVLNRYSDYPLVGMQRDLNLKLMTTSQAPQVLYIAWKKIAVAARKINTIKADQVCQIADLFEKYPKILKKTTDPSQQPRANTNHIVLNFRRLAKNTREYQWLGGSPHWHRGGGIFASAFMPIVPFDSCLRLFGRQMQEKPVLRPIEGSHDWTPYPKDIAEDIKTTIAGLSYTYTQPLIKHKMNPFSCLIIQRPRLPRTKFSQFSAGPLPYASQIARSANCNEIPKLSPVVHEHVAQFHHWKPLCQNVAGLFPYPHPCHGLVKWDTLPGYEYLARRNLWKLGRVPFAEPASPDDCWNKAHEHPVFICPPRGYLGLLFEKKVAAKAGGWNWDYGLLPFDEREIEWLAAFCRVVTYLQGLEDVGAKEATAQLEQSTKRK